MKQKGKQNSSIEGGNSKRIMSKKNIKKLTLQLRSSYIGKGPKKEEEY